MNLKLIRKEFTEISTIGDLYVDGNFYCYTLEDRVREIKNQPVGEWKIPGKTAIPYGTYSIILDFSNRFQKILPRLLDVSGFDGIRIHSGNVAENTEGCILVGFKKQKDFISESKICLSKLFESILSAINNNETVTITIGGENVV